jgi:hypothetical protein
MKDILYKLGVDYVEFDELSRVIVIRGKTTPKRLRGDD